MIDIAANLRLKDILSGEKPFPIGVELVSTRGTMREEQTLKARAFAEALTHSPRVDWVSITDNAGGNPQLAPVALGTPVLYAGKEVVVHLTCKDMNRHALESQLWLLASQGFHNVLAMTGDYPLDCYAGQAKPVFDIDSVALLAMIKRLNDGLELRGRQAGRKLGATHFHAGAVVCNFKRHENTLLPQYYKLEKKLEQGAGFIINQIGFDSRKCHELLEYFRWRNLPRVPVIGNVYVLNGTVARLFHEMKIPGVTLSDALYELCRKQAASPDKGKAFFLEFAAKQLAVYRGLGFAAGYLGGTHSYPAIEKILDLEQSFAPDDWRQFAKEISFSRPGEFFLFERDEETGLVRPGRVNATWQDALRRREHTHNVTPLYQLSKIVHRLAFEHGRGIAPLAAKWCAAARNPSQGPAPIRLMEKFAKSLLYACRDCGDCSLGETAFLCPESQCAKNQRNGPCGGTREGKCEIHDFECIWARAYDRLKSEGRADQLLAHSPVVQDQGLRDTSSWANFWLHKDHAAKTENAPEKGA